MTNIFRYVLLFAITLSVTAGLERSAISATTPSASTKTSPLPVTQTSSIKLFIYDGTRRLAAGEPMLVRLRDGEGKELFNGYLKGPTIQFTALPIRNNYRDSYTITVSARNNKSAGLVGVKVQKAGVTQVSLMLVARVVVYDFRQARWQALKTHNPEFVRIISAGTASDTEAMVRYYQLLLQSPDSAACLLNILTALDSFPAARLPPLLPFVQELTWDYTMSQDRVYGYVAAEFIEVIAAAARGKMFSRAAFPSIEHQGATSSFRELSFAEANLQITFHERNRKLINGRDCVRVEFDIDYYRDLFSHLFLEVIPNTVSTHRTDPQKVYRLRWTASINANRPFAPPYVLRQSNEKPLAARGSQILPPWRWKIRRHE